MKTFDTFANAEGWDSAASAFRDDFAAGARVQVAPWGGFAILGHRELLALARDPLADGMAPEAEAMAATPKLHRLFCRALFTKSGASHRAERAALIDAFNAVPIAAIVREAVAGIVPPGPAVLDLRSGLAAPLVLAIWAAIVGYETGAAARLAAAVSTLGPFVSPTAGPGDAQRADDAAEEIRDLSLAALDARTPFSQNLRTRVGDDLAADLVAGMAFDAVETAAVGVDAALRVAFAHREAIGRSLACVNECLRVASSTPLTMRRTTGEIRLDGLTFPAGTALSMIWSAGNHDPLAFPDPGRFEPARFAADGSGPGAGPARPLAFGAGQHSCLGHAVVRAALLELLGLVENRNAELKGDPGGWNPLAPTYLPPVEIRI